MEPLMQTKNYLEQQDLQVDKVLLHACCGPCAEAPIVDLWEAGVDLTLYYFNPNIYPVAEWERRREAIEQVAALRNLELIVEKGDRKALQMGLEELQKQCARCYTVRFEKAAQTAKEHGFDYFASTLLVSPYQNHELLVEKGQEVGQKYGVTFLAIDWRPIYRLGQNIAQEHGIYRQKYCACWASLMGSKFKDEILKSLEETA